MILRVAVLLVIAVSLGGFSAVAWFALHDAPPSPPPQPVALAAKPVLVPIVVAAYPLHAGQLLQPKDVTTRDFPADAVPAGAIADTPSARRDATGALLRVSIPAGGLVVAPDLVLPGDHGYLAAVLSPGKRAVSVGVDAVSGIAGLVWPGDYVDLILTQSLDNAGTPVGHRMAAETVLTGLRIIATDQDLVRGEVPASVGAAQRTITLEATPEQAERIQIASRLGHLSLSVCPLAECADHAGSERIVWGSDLSAALAGSGTGQSTTLHVFDGTSDQKDYHF